MNYNMGMGMGGGMNMNMNMGGMNMMYSEPVYQQISVGQGIDQREYQTIINCCKQAYMAKISPMSNQAGKLIKQHLGGEWFVITSSTFQKKYDFCVTSVEGGDFMAFSLDSTMFQAVKTKSNYGFQCNYYEVFNMGNMGFNNNNFGMNIGFR